MYGQSYKEMKDCKITRPDLLVFSWRSDSTFDIAAILDEYEVDLGFKHCYADVFSLSSLLLRS